MVRRWVIRVPFLLGLGCVVGVWVASCFGLFGAWWTWHGADWGVGAVAGDVFYVHTPDLNLADRPATFEFHGSGALKDLGRRPLMGGFHWGVAAGNPGWGEMFYHLWFPTMVLLGVNGLVWWATQRRAVRGGFPVEVGKGEA